MVSLLLLGEYCSSPSDEDPEYLTQVISIIFFLPPPKKGENLDYVPHVKKSKETKLEDAIGKRAEKCIEYDKKSFIKGCQSSHHDIISCLANLVVFLEFILVNEGTSEVPAIIYKCSDLSKEISSRLLSETTQKRTKRLSCSSPIHWFATFSC